MHDRKIWEKPVYELMKEVISYSSMCLFQREVGKKILSKYF